MAPNSEIVTLPTESVFGVRMLHMLTESGTKRASVWRVRNRKAFASPFVSH